MALDERESKMADDREPKAIRVGGFSIPISVALVVLSLAVHAGVVLNNQHTASLERKAIVTEMRKMLEAQSAIRERLAAVETELRLNSATEAR